MTLTQDKYKIFKLLLLIGITIAISSCHCKKVVQEKSNNNLLQACPEEWYQNKMPGTTTSEVSEYFIYEGKRRELKEFDLEWIKKNCDVKPQIVQ
jgi:hypothetical protein